MRMAGDRIQSAAPGVSDESWQRFGAPIAGQAEGPEIAMTPAQARGLLNRFASEAAAGNMTPSAFTTGLNHLGHYGRSPDAIRREIRNVMASPVGRAAISNPGVARSLAERALGSLRGAGVNPETGKKHLGVAVDLLRQAKQDNLLRSNVTVEEVRDGLQRPLYSALQGWARDNRSNPQFNSLIKRDLPQIRGYRPDGTEATPVETMLHEFLFK